MNKNFCIYSGQERFLALSPMYYRNAETALVVYDVTSLDSFLAVRKWTENLYAVTGHMDKQSSTMKSLILVGNKADQPDDATTSDDTSKEANGRCVEYCIFMAIVL